MNPNDSIIMALTPGTPFNAQNKVWRSLATLAQFARIPAAEVQDLLAGDLAEQVICRPSKHPEKGFLVALKAHVPAAPENQVQILGGPAVVVAHKALADQPLVAKPKAAIQVMEDHGLADYLPGDEPEEDDPF